MSFPLPSLDSSRPIVDQVADAVLYEGYILYPYRPSVKNRQRWTFGGLVPRTWSEANSGAEPWNTVTECLVQGSESTRLRVRVRFLHLMARTVAELVEPVAELPQGEEPAYRVVPALRLGNQVLQSWQEAEAREVLLGPREPTDETSVLLGELIEDGVRREFTFSGRRQREAVSGPTGEVIGLLFREQQPVAGRVEVRATRVGELFKVTVQVSNHTPVEGVGKSRDEVLLHALVSTHTILEVREGEFVSLLDPPEHWRQVVSDCHNVGTWPVLVGEPGQRDTMLSAPIILYDYPQVAPESPGDFFDATEIDEMLALRILTLTEEEKKEMASVDEGARALLERTEGLSPEQLLRLHGAVRSLRPIRGEESHGGVA